MKQLTLFQSEDEHSNASLDTRSNANARSSGHGIFFPCPIAREMPIGETRCNHIKNCSECKRLIEALDRECGVER